MPLRSQLERAAFIDEKKGAAKVAAIYAIVASVWIWLSDEATLLIAADAESFAMIQAYKGWFFVLVTSVLLYWVLSQFVETVDRWESTVMRTRERLQETLDSVATAIAITDPDGIYSYVNPAYCELFGYEADELIGEPATKTGLGGSLPERSPAGTLAHAREHRSGWRGEALRVDKDGRIIPVFLTVSPLYQDGELYGFMGDLVDLRSIKDWPPYVGGFALSLQRLATAASLDELGEAVVAEAIADLGADVGLVALYNEDGSALVPRWQAGCDDDLPDSIPVSEGLWGRALEQRRTLWVEEAAVPALEMIPGVDAIAAAATPLVVDDELIGVLIIGSQDTSCSIGEYQVRMLEALARTLVAGFQREAGFRREAAGQSGLAGGFDSTEVGRHTSSRSTRPPPSVGGG